MKILFVHEVDYLSKVVFEMQEFPEKLAAKGHEVHFLDFPENQPLRRPRFRMKRRLISGRTDSTVQLTLHSMPRYLPYPLDRLYAAITSYFLLRKLLRRLQPDCVVIYGVPTNGWQAIRACREMGIPSVYRAIDVSHELRRSVFRPLIRRAEHFVYSNADLVLTNNDALRDYGRNHGARAENIHTLFPGFELPLSAHKQQRRTRSIIFMGTLFRFAGLEWFIRLMREQCREDVDLKIKIIGSGEAESKLHRLVAELEMESSVEFTGQVAFDDLPSEMGEGAIAVLPFDESKVARYALPGKVPQYLLCGLPTVSTRLPGLLSLFPEGCGVRYVEPGTEFVTTVMALLDNDEARRELVRDGRRILEQRCNWREVIQEFEVHLTSLTGK
jgi:glycosyltransferase involved in cell wall biosynthesis